MIIIMIAIVNNSYDEHDCYMKQLTLVSTC